MAIRIAKVDAGAAASPIHAALDGDGMLSQTSFPGVKVGGRNRKREMQFAVSAVRRNDAAWKGDGLSRAALFEQQQNMLIRDVEGAKAVIAVQNRKAKHVLVKLARARNILDVQRGFQDAGYVHTRTSRRPVSSNRIGNFAASSRLCVTTTRIVLRARCKSNSSEATA